MKTQKKQKKAFTLIELIVVITILAILGTIAFISLQGYSSNSRDSVRLTDVDKMKTALELYSVKTGFYPTPKLQADGGKGIEKTYTKTGVALTTGSTGNVTTTAWTEGKFDNEMYIQVGKLSKKPVDPLDKSIEYTYSKAKYQNQYELLINLEDENRKFAMVEETFAADNYNTRKIDGTYNGYYIKTILPGAVDSSKTLLLGTPTIISGNLTESQLNSSSGKTEIKLPGDIDSVENNKQIKIDELYIGKEIPKTDAEIEEFTKNLKTSFNNEGILTTSGDYDTLEKLETTNKTRTVEVGSAILGITSVNPDVDSCPYGSGTPISDGGSAKWFTSGIVIAPASCGAGTTYYCKSGKWYTDNTYSTEKSVTGLFPSCSDTPECQATTKQYESETGKNISIPTTSVGGSGKAKLLGATDASVNAKFNYAIEYTCTNTGSAYKFTYSNPTKTYVECRDSTYHRVGSTDVCESNTKTITTENCGTGLPTNAGSFVKNSLHGDNFEQTCTWNSGSWDCSPPSLNWSENQIAGQCTFKCNDGLAFQAGKCVTPTNEGTCSGGLVPGDINHTVMFSANDKFVRTTSDGGVTYTPLTKEWTHKNDTAASGSSECRVECKSGYVWDNVGKTCKESPKETTCGVQPANTTNNSTGGKDTFTQTWQIAPTNAYTAAKTWTYSATDNTGECTFKCATNYFWDADSSSCVNWCIVGGTPGTHPGIDNCTIK